MSSAETAHATGPTARFRRYWLLPLCTLTLVLAAGMAGGYYLGWSRANESSLADWGRELADQQDQLDAARARSQAAATVLARRLGRLQAHVDRLDALGRSLVKMAELKPGEFDFGHPPGLGGPSSPVEGPAVRTPSIDRALDSFARKLDDREQQLRVLDRLVMSHRLHAQVHPAGRPIAGGWISSPFGWRRDPFTGKPEFHGGIDFAGKAGSDVTTVASGVVTFAGKRHGYGNVVEIDHGNGYMTRYAHNRRDLVTPGERVHKGQTIAILGSTGRATGAHVHLEVLKDGKRVNPAKFMHATH